MILLFLFAASALVASAQTNRIAITNQSPATNAPRENVHVEVKEDSALVQQVEKVRVECIGSRRRICGKIVKVLPEGLVIDSGYTNLIREPLNRSWLIPGTAEAAKPANLIEENRTGSVCMGLVFLTDLPNAPAKPRLYDYVNLEAFPIGSHTYVSVGDLHRTVRGFSARLVKSVEWKLQQSQNEKKENTPAK